MCIRDRNPDSARVSDFLLAKNDVGASNGRCTSLDDSAGGNVTGGSSSTGDTKATLLGFLFAFIFLSLLSDSPPSLVGELLDVLLGVFSPSRCTLCLHSLLQLSHSNLSFDGGFRIPWRAGDGGLVDGAELVAGRGTIS